VVPCCLQFHGLFPHSHGAELLDKRKAWREEEQRLVANWNSAAERLRAAQDEASRQAVQAEIDTLRKRVARIKVEFSSGKRY